MAHTTPMSIRIADDVHDELRRAAQAEHNPKSALAERLLVEGLAMRKYPGVIFIGEPPRRRAAVSGTGLDVWEIALTARNCGSTDEVLDLLNIKPMHLNAALSYYRDHREEIDELIARNQRPPAVWEEEFPEVFGDA